jgi:hypothetical protein
MRGTITCAVVAVAFGAGAAAAAGQTGGLVRPNGSPAPSSPDASMPPSLPAPPAPTTLAQRNGMYNAGSTLSGVGAGLIIAGAVFIPLGVALPCKGSGCKSATEAQSDKVMGDVFIGTGTAGLIIGGVCLAIGIPLWIAGYGQISRALERGEGALHFGPGGVGLTF